MRLIYQGIGFAVWKIGAEGDSSEGENFVPWDSVQNLAPGALTTR